MTTECIGNCGLHSLLVYTNFIQCSYMRHSFCSKQCMKFIIRYSVKRHSLINYSCSSWQCMIILGIKFNSAASNDDCTDVIAVPFSIKLWQTQLRFQIDLELMVYVTAWVILTITAGNGVEMTAETFSARNSVTPLWKWNHQIRHIHPMTSQFDDSRKENSICFWNLCECIWVC